MPRLLGVDIPDQKRTLTSLTYLYGVGPKVAADVLEELGIDPYKKARELTEDELSRLAGLIETKYAVEGQLRRQTQQNITRLKEIRCLRGLRHIRNLPVRGQRTKTNARTRKGPKRMVAKKK